MPTFKRAILALFLVLAPPALAGCGDLRIVDSTGTRERTWYVAAEKVTCYGFHEKECLLMKYDLDDEWQLHYDGIAGFTHEAGYEYALRVLEQPIVNPPQDSGSMPYSLVRVIEKHSVPMLPGGA